MRERFLPKVRYIWLWCKATVSFLLAFGRELTPKQRHEGLPASLFLCAVRSAGEQDPSQQARAAVGLVCIRLLQTVVRGGSVYNVLSTTRDVVA